MRPDRFFKYVTAETAQIILNSGTLRWSCPNQFNDPFDLKHDIEIGFEWEEIRLPLMTYWQKEFVAAVRQEAVRQGRSWADSDLGQIPESIQAQITEDVDSSILEFQSMYRQQTEDYLRRKQDFRILCFSEIHDGILMWSHYANSHKGVVLAFKPNIEHDSVFLAAQRVNYLDEVPLLLILEEFLEVVISQKPPPKMTDLFKQRVYTKSTAWKCEEEWRVFTTRKEPRDGVDPDYSDRLFHVDELVEIYFGCCIDSANQRAIESIVEKRGYHVKMYKMRAERYRYKLETLPHSPRD
jgi:hypothetical protein